MSVANEYVSKMEGEHKEIAQKLVEIIQTTLPDSYKPVSKWGIPVWWPIVGILDTKKFVSIWLWQGGKIVDPKKKLVGDGKSFKRYPIHSLDELDEKYIRKLLKESLDIIE